MAANLTASRYIWVNLAKFVDEEDWPPEAVTKIMEDMSDRLKKIGEQAVYIRLIDLVSWVQRNG